MREVEFKQRAISAIDAVCEFIEEQNTPGSSVKWYHALIKFIVRRAGTTRIKFPLCNYHKFAAKKYSCFVYKKQWIVVFKYTDSKLAIYQFVHGSRLK